MPSWLGRMWEFLSTLPTLSTPVSKSPVLTGEFLGAAPRRLSYQLLYMAGWLVPLGQQSTWPARRQMLPECLRGPGAFTPVQAPAVTSRTHLGELRLSMPSAIAPSAAQNLPTALRPNVVMGTNCCAPTATGLPAPRPPLEASASSVLVLRELLNIENTAQESPRPGPVPLPAADQIESPTGDHRPPGQCSDRRAVAVEPSVR